MAVHTFFISSAGSEHDRREVLRFHADLLRAVKGVLGDSASGGLGWFLKGLWEPALLDMCGTAKVLVALFSPDYAGSDWCRQEWGIFMDRVVQATPPEGEAPWCIMNVWWARRMDEPPSPFRDVQWPDWHLTKDVASVEEYRQKGLLYLQRNHERRYQRLCDDLAYLVAEAAALDLPPLAAAPELPAEEGARPGWQGLPPEPDAPASQAATGTTMIETPTGVDPVARLLADVPALEGQRAWEDFVKRIGAQQGYYIPPFGQPRPLPERCSALVALLVDRNGERRAYGLVLAGLEAVEEAGPTAAAIARVIAGLPDGTS